MSPQELIKKVKDLGYTVNYNNQGNAVIYVEDPLDTCYLVICKSFNDDYWIKRSDGVLYEEEMREGFCDTQHYVGFVDGKLQERKKNSGGWQSFSRKAENKTVEYNDSLEDLENLLNPLDSEFKALADQQEKEEQENRIKELELGLEQERKNKEEAALKAKIEQEKKNEINDPSGWINLNRFAEEIGKKYPEAKIKLPADTPSEMHKWRQTHGEQQLHVPVDGVTLTFHQHKNQVNLDDYEFIFIPRENTVDQFPSAEKEGKKAYLVEQEAGSAVPAKLVIFEKGVPKGIDVGYQFWTKPEVKKELEEVKKEIKKEAKIDQKTNPICPLKGKFLELVRDYAVEHYKRELRVSFHIGLDPTKKESDQQKDKNDRIQRSIDAFVDMIQQSSEFKNESGIQIRAIDITVINPKDLRNQLMSALKAKGFAHITYEGQLWIEDGENTGKFKPRNSGNSGGGVHLSNNRNALMSQSNSGSNDDEDSSLSPDLC